MINIGLFDLFSSVQQATVDPVWLGMSTEGYVFAALIYWIFCFSMSRYSQNLEKRFNTGRTKKRGNYEPNYYDTRRRDDYAGKCE